MLFLAPLAGVLADRRDRVGIIRVTQLAAAPRRRLLAILVFTGAITIQLLFALVLALGVANALAQPARLALIPTLVDRESLASAVAINSIVFNLARFVGPAVAGILIADVSVAAAFAANAVSYIAFQVSLADLRGLPPFPPLPRQNALRASVDAYAYASRHPGIGADAAALHGDDDRHARLCRAVPGFADSVFHRGPQGLSMLTSTVGLGAIFGGAWMVLRPAIAGPRPASCSATPC